MCYYYPEFKHLRFFLAMTAVAETKRISIAHDGEAKPNQIPLEYMSFGKIEFPRFLVTQATFEAKMKKIRALMSKTKTSLKQGQPKGDSGDDHGTYHSEVTCISNRDGPKRRNRNGPKKD